jgi:hypothetical protein
VNVTDLINLDPSTVVVTRHTKVPHSGGFDYTTSTLGAQTVRCYYYSTRAQQESVILEGEVKNIILGVLAQIGADFVCSHASYDTFTWQGREFRIVGVRHYTDINVPAQVQCDAVAV